MQEIITDAITTTTSDRSKITLPGPYPSSNCKVTPQQLLKVLEILPKHWALVAVGDNKAPLGRNWTTHSLTPEDFEKAIQASKFETLLVGSKQKEPFHPPITWWSAIGVLCGVPSGGLLFIDHDGVSCDSLIEEISGQPITEALPRTVAVTSGRKGRCQLLYKVPEEFWEAIATKKIPTGCTDDDGKPEQLELRWTGSQSVVAGYHPITGSYKWLDGRSPQECEVAEAPRWAIEQMLQEPPLHQAVQPLSKHQPSRQTWTDRDWARSYLAAIPPTEDYETWLRVGMALQAVGEDLLPDWDNWSRGAINYEPTACAAKWKTFKPTGGIGLRTLAHLAKQHGWKSPHKETRSDRPALAIVGGKTGSRAASPSLEDVEEDFEELVQEVQSFVRLTEESAPVHNLLSPRLTVPLSYRAQQFNVPLEAFIGLLLPIAASLLEVGTQLEIAASTDYRCSPILWTGLVGESGANKSPIFNTLIRPLIRLQAAADEIYQLEFAQYEDELEDWQKTSKEERGSKPALPVQREYYLQDATLEAIAACSSSQPNRGVVIPIDELAGFFNGFNQYRSGGKGNDRQKFLSSYNGDAIKVNRKSGNRISLAQTSISLTGTIQPCVLRKHMADLDDIDGFWARFLWVPLPLSKMPPPGEGCSFDLSELLQALYRGLESLPPAIYYFDSQGQAIWRDWHNYCEDYKLAESNSALRSIYPKSKDRAARIALIAHCINAVIEGHVPEATISGELLESAIAFTKWSIGQARLIYADAGAVSYEETAKIVRFIERFRSHEWITARNVIHWWSPKPKPGAEVARAFMQEIVNLGHAIDNGKSGREYAIRIKGNDGNEGNEHSQSLAEEGFSLGNISGNNLVTRGNSNFVNSPSSAFELNSEVGSPVATPTTGVTTDSISPSTSNTKGSDEFSIDLLPSVTPAVTTSDLASGMGSTGICYPVTNTMLQVGDRVVLMGEGNDRPSAEVQAIWTVKTILDQKAIVENKELNRQSFPLAWLAPYEQAAQ